MILRTWFEEALIGLALVGPDGAWVRTNSRFQATFGGTFGPERGDVRELLHPDDRAEHFEEITRVLRGERETGTFGARCIRPDGQTIWVTLKISAAGDLVLDEQHAAFLVQVCDESPLVKAEEALHESLRREHAIVNGADYMIIATDPDGIITVFNHAAERWLGYEASEVVGKASPAIIHDLSEVVARAEALTRELGVLVEPGFGTFIAKARLGMPDENEWTYIRKDGSRFPVLLSVTGLFNAEKQVTGYLGIVKDITAQKLAREELMRALHAAEAGARAKSEFLASMSHEIRTPMNGVIGMTGLLLDTQLSGEQREFVEIIRTSGEALLTIINDILDFSKIEAGAFELERHAFSLRSCVEEALDVVASWAQKSHVEIAALVAPEIPDALYGDVTRIRQILVNLVSNALKFTERGEVVVRAWIERPAADMDGELEVYVEVRDTGIGIATESMERLFRSFSQVDASISRRYGGTGLGLAICKRLVELMGGRIWVESEVGVGSKFTFTFRAAVAPAIRANVPKASLQELAGMRVLIVDDNATNRHILTLQAKAWGMVPTAASSAVEALQILRNEPPFALGILDVAMPEMTGVDLATAIRADRALRDLPLIMLTSTSDTQVRRDAAQLGVLSFLYKPVKQAQLLDTIMMAVAPQNPVLRRSSERGKIDPSFAARLPLRILLAEDNAINQKVALLILQKIGYRADVAANGIEVLEATARTAYDVIFMDVQMPEVDGLEATRRLRSNQAPSFRPWIIAMTANAMEEDRQICRNAGMDDFVPKPVQAADIVAALQRAAETIEKQRKQ